MVIVSITPEIALNGLKNYAGGLGILEGDKFYGAGDLGLDYVVFSFMYRYGYVDIGFESENIVFKPQKHDVNAYRLLKPDSEFKISLRGEEVIVQPWIYEYKSARAVLFEAVCPMWARSLTDQVYIDSSIEQQFLKYAFLAKAASYYLKNNIGLENVDTIDLQESHTSLILFTLNNTKKFRIIIHTPGPWGHPGFPGDYISREFGVFISDYVSLTRYALEKIGSGIVVSLKHKDIMSKVFPEYAGKLKAITNGIYLERWMNKDLYQLRNSGELNVDKLVDVKTRAKRELEDLLNKYKDGVEIGDRMIIAWNRRIVRYKRPYFIARFIEENPNPDVIYVLAGKPHPMDNDGINYTKWFRRLHLKFKNVVFINDYDIDIAKKIFQASDLLLFTPFSGWEACGTSYMKALVNGTPVLSSRDGGVLEIVEDNVNGWLFGNDLRDFVNIYTDKRAEEIDKVEYIEFSAKLKNIIEMHENSREKYWSIGLRAVNNVPSRVDVKNVLKKYYLETT